MMNILNSDTLEFHFKMKIILSNEKIKKKKNPFFLILKWVKAIDKNSFGFYEIWKITEIKYYFFFFIEWNMKPFWRYLDC